MPLEPRHPDETPLHFALRDAFNQHLQNRDFFIWLDVRPTGRGRQFENMSGIVAETEAWLALLDPDAIDADHLPEYWLKRPVANVKLRAIPRKREVRGQRAAEIVGNPGPTLAGWR